LKNATVIGLQWGDEGKGKIIDTLASDSDLVIRFQGGSNAGHTVIVGGQKYVFHLVPSGILYPDVTCVIGNGVVVDILQLQQEIKELRKRGVDVSRLRISSIAHVVMPYHKAIDEAREEHKSKIGTTKRGIGPCYGDKVARIGIRIEDLYNSERLLDLLERNLEEKNSILRGYGKNEIKIESILDTYSEAASFISEFVSNTDLIVEEAIREDKLILFEGAQGIMLDIDHGTYPYVTSSNTHPANAACGSAASIKALGEVLGVSKAYTTRVGEGPFPTELKDSSANHLQQKGKEFGATTGRPRRCGWLDLCQLKYAVRVTGTQQIVLTKLDVLAGLPVIKVATGYSNPQEFRRWDTAKPTYVSLPGIPDIDAAKITRWSQLPKEAHNYISFIEQEVGVPIKFVSIGPQRSAILEVR
jgi:adenylosuccinate synthase